MRPRVVIDISSLLINPYSGLSDIVDHLVSGLLSTECHHRFVLYQNAFRHVHAPHSLRGDHFRYFNIPVPRRLMEMWWRFEWPAFDRLFPVFDVFHSLHIHLPPVRRAAGVLTVHDCRFLEAPACYTQHQRAAYRRQMRRSLSRATLVTTVSHATKNALLRHFKYPPENVFVIRNGFDAEGTRKAVSIQAGMSLGAVPENTDDYLLYIGSIDPRKNLVRLLAALGICCRKHPGFPKLMVIGISTDEWGKTGLMDLAKKHGVEQQIILKGKLNKEALLLSLKNALGLCYPSIYEGFGLPPLEAMALRVPVLAGRNAAVAEISQDGALLVDPYDIDDMAGGLDTIVSDVNTRDRLKAAGDVIAEQYPWRESVKKYIQVYDRAASL